MNYQKWMDGQQPSEALVQDTLARAAQRPAPRHGRRVLAAALAACLCVLLAVPALARTQTGYQMLYRLSPQLALLLTPVQESDEDNGIRMEVIAASVEGSRAQIYIGLQDLTGDRLDGTVDLFDSYSIDVPYDCAGTCQLISYDETGHMATFLVTLEMFDEKPIPAGKLRFGLREFISRKQHIEGADTGLDLQQAQLDAAVLQQELTGRGGDYDEADDTVLQPTLKLPLPGADFTCTALGYVDGQLRVQVATQGRLEYDAHCNLYLQNAAGQRLESTESRSFQQEQDGTRTDYDEFLFDVPASELSSWSLYGDFYTAGLNTQGNWSVAFQLEP